MAGLGAGSRRPGSPPGVWVAGLLALAAAAFAIAQLREHASQPIGIAHRPYAAVPRLGQIAGFTARDIYAVNDFEWVDDRLYLLDGRGVLVAGLVRGVDGTWRERLRIDARGGGPGELELPVSVAEYGDGRIAILDGERLHTFSAEGAPLETRSMGLPCQARRGVLAVLGGNALYLAATCADGAPSSDTVSALLWRVAADRLEELARAPRFTRDARWGNAYTTDRVLGAGRDRLLFGSGLDACVWTVGAASAAPVRRCGLATDRFLSEAPAELKALERMPKELLGRAWRWQRALPYFHDLAVAASADVLIRLWSPDSVLLRASRHDAAGSEDLLVAPFNGLVGCRAGGCLWRTGADLEGVRLVALEMAVIEHLIDAAAADRIR